MPKPKSAAATAEVKVVYPEITAEVYLGKEALTVDQAKTFLGWEELADDDQSAYLLTDRNGKKIRCTNILPGKQRQIKMSEVEKLVQDRLNGRWRPNGQVIILSNHGNVNDGQKRLIALVLAEQDRTGVQAMHWAEAWPEPLTLECQINKGWPDDAETLRTLDNTQTRGEEDVLQTAEVFTSPKIKPDDRKTMVRMLKYAINLLWDRTKAGNNAFVHYRTRSELVDFVDSHKRILKAVQHIFGENKGGAIAKYLSAGYASGLLYLMGASASDIDTYCNDLPRSERKLSWVNWDRAEEFFVELAKEDKGKLAKVLSKAHRPVVGANGKAVEAEVFQRGDASGSLTLRIAVLAKAWQVWVQNQEPTLGDLKVKHDVKADKNGAVDSITIAENVTVGGIDLGEEDYEAPQAGDPTPDEVEAAKAEIDEENGVDGNLVAADEDDGAAEEEKRQARIQALKDAKARKTAAKATEGLTPAGKEAQKAAANGTPAPTPTPAAPVKPAKPGKPLTRKQQEAENTRKAKEADATAKAGS